MVVISTLAFALATAASAELRSLAPLCVALLIGGFGWIAITSVLNTAAQLSAAVWVQARAIAVYLLAFQGSLAFGSAAWGAIGAHQRPDPAAAGRGRVGGRTARDLCAGPWTPNWNGDWNRPTTGARRS